MKFLTVHESLDTLLILRRHLEEHFKRLLDAEVETRALDTRSTGVFPLINVSETPDVYLLIAEVPGLSVEDFHIDISDEGMTIECRRGLGEGVTEESFRRQERWHGTMRRELSFARRVDPEGATAELSAGVLSMSIPKVEPSKKRRLDVKPK